MFGQPTQLLAAASLASAHHPFTQCCIVEHRSAQVLLKGVRRSAVLQYSPGSDAAQRRTGPDPLLVPGLSDPLGSEEF